MSTTITEQTSTTEAVEAAYASLIEHRAKVEEFKAAAKARKKEILDNIKDAKEACDTGKRDLWEGHLREFENPRLPDGYNPNLLRDAGYKPEIRIPMYAKLDETEKQFDKAVDAYHLSLCNRQMKVRAARRANVSKEFLKTFSDPNIAESFTEEAATNVKFTKCNDGDLLCSGIDGVDRYRRLQRLEKLIAADEQELCL
jgi:hypothetical protein